jgi:uncharacterized protein
VTPPSTIGLRRLIEALVIAAIGGLAFDWLGVPAGLVSGSMLAVGLAALAGRPLAVPAPFARVVFFCIGVTLGSVVTPETLRGITAYPASIALLAVCTVCMTAATTFYLVKVHRWSPLTGLFGASPGALAQVMAMCAEAGLDLRGVAIVQSMRVVLLTVGLPAGLAAFGLAADVPPARSVMTTASINDLAILVVASLVPALALQWVRFSGGVLFGAMVGSAALHGSGYIEGGLPWWLASAAAIALGAITGSRFSGTRPRVLLAYLGAALGSFSVAIAIAAMFMLVVARLVDIPAADVVIAYAPGAQDTMMFLALVLHLDPIFIGVHHISRFLLVSLSLPFVAKLLPGPGRD